LRGSEIRNGITRAIGLGNWGPVALLFGDYGWLALIENNLPGSRAISGLEKLVDMV
jgi:hypothetical protein